MKWQIRESDPVLSARIARRLNISPFLSSILAGRGIDSPEKAYYFMYGDIENTVSPFVFKEMPKTVDYLRKLIAEKKPLYIVGDKDVDGMTGTAIYYSFFQQAGIPAIYWSLPCEEESYGFSERIYNTILSSPEVDTVITVDCGIKENQFIRRLKEKEINTIITDHHTPDGDLPEAFSIINPHLENPYRMDYLSGAAVALKVVQGLYFSFHSFYNREMFFLSRETSGEFRAVRSVNFVPDPADYAFSSLNDLKARLKNASSSVLVAAHEDLALFKKEFKDLSPVFLDIQGFGSVKAGFKGRLESLEKLCEHFSVFHEPGRRHKTLFSLTKKLFFKYHLKMDEKLSVLLQYATLGTVCDYMPMNAVENHILVKNGLSSLNQKAPLYIKLLTSDKPKIDMRDIGFSIGPVLNSGGRLGKSHQSFQFLIENESEEVKNLFSRLKSLNDRRKKIGDTGFKEALNDIELYQKEEEVLFHTSANIIQGVTGIIANRITQRYKRPSFVFCLNEETGDIVGSGRSFSDVDMLLMLYPCQDLLKRFGGHKKACGMSFASDKLESIIQAIREEGKKYLNPEMLEESFFYDLEIRPEEVSLKLSEELKALYPFGPDHENPVFLSRSVTPFSVRLMGGKMNHLKFKIKENPALDFIGWNMAEKEDLLKYSRIDVLYCLEENFYNGKLSLQGMVADLRESRA